MARTSGHLVMTGSKDGEYSMTVEFSDDIMPHPLRKEGYYLGQKTRTAMIQELSKISGNLQSTGASTGVDVDKPDVIVENIATASTDELRNVESQSSTESPKQATPGFNSPLTAIDSVEEVPETSQSVVGIQLQVGPYKEKPVRSVGRAPDSLRRDCSEEDDEVEIAEVDEYNIFVGDQSNPVSLCVLPLEIEDQELIGGSVSTTEVSLCGKSGGLEIMRPITAWKLIFPENGSFHILVKITQTSGAKRWVKLEKPRSGYKETAEDVFCVAKFLAILKKEPHASEDRVRNHFLEGDVLSATFCDHLSKQYSLMEKYINLDPVLKEADARKTLLSLTREKVPNAGKRRLLLDEDRSDEDDNPPVKKAKTDHASPEDVSMRESESEEEFYDDEEEMDDEDDESDDEPGDSLCIICDDGGNLLCCDGPCMRSFHPRISDGRETDCRTLRFPDDSDIGRTTSQWLCRNCKVKRHQCYVCGELGDSDRALGVKREVFVCDVAACGKFYHPRCVASKLKPTADESETLAKDIQAEEESFTCPLHRCKECGKGEEKKEEDLKLAICRRCPVAWHVKCLPRNLSFEENEESHFEIRAWKLDKRFIVYCTDHKIIKDLGTPERNHLKLSPLLPEAAKIFKKPQKKVSTIANEPPGFRAKASSSAVSIGRSAGTARPERQHTSEDADKRSADAAKRLVEDIVTKSAQKVTEQSVKGKLFLPKNYLEKEFTWMRPGRFDSILNGARAAAQKLLQSKNWDEAKLKCARDQLVAIITEEDHLRTFLAPTLHGKRYTSYGRHFTKLEKLQKVVELLQPLIWERDTIVDFSCGDNSFSRLLHDTLSNAGKTNCQYKNFDIFPSKDTFGFERKDWLSVGMNDCGPGDNLVIGLNPPYAHTERFVNHALGMTPRLLVLIIPPLKHKLEHRGYVCLLDDDTTMAEKSFYLPGSVHGFKNDFLEQGNNVAPHLYIYCRRKFYGHYNDGASKAEPSTANPSQQIQQIRKSVKPVKPAKRAPPSDPDIFIPAPASQHRSRDPRSVSVRPQHVQNRMSRPLGPGSQIEEGEITVSRGHTSFNGSPSYLPPPPSRPARPSRPSQFRNTPYDHPPQFSPHFRSHHPSEFPRPHHSPDEYSPFAPALFPPGLEPRGLLPPPFGLPPPYPPPGPPFRLGPPLPWNQQFHQGPSASRGPDYPPRTNFEGDHDGESGGWLS